MRKAQTFGVFAVIFACLLLSVACEKDTATDDAGKIQIGSLLPFTGALANSMQAAAGSVNLAVTNINAAGGVLGKELQLVERDSATDPATGTQAAKELIENEGVEIIFGAASSGVTMALLAETVPAGVLVVNGMSSLPAITATDNDGLFYRSYPRLNLTSDLAAEAIEDKGYSKVAIIASLHPGMAVTADVFQSKFESMTCGGGACTATRHDYPPDADLQTYDFASIVGDELDSAEPPDVFYVAGYTDDSIAVIQAIESKSFTGPIVATEALGGISDVDQVLSSALLAQIRWASVRIPTSTEMDAFKTSYQQVLGEEVPGDQRVYSSYDMVMILGLAIEKAGSMDPSLVKDAIRDVTNAPGTQVSPTGFADAIKLINEGQDVDYVGITNVEFDELGDVSNADVAILGYSDNDVVVSTIP